MPTGRGFPEALTDQRAEPKQQTVAADSCRDFYRVRLGLQRLLPKLGVGP